MSGHVTRPYSNEAIWYGPPLGIDSQSLALLRHLETFKPGKTDLHSKVVCSCLFGYLHSRVTCLYSLYIQVQAHVCVCAFIYIALCLCINMLPSGTFPTCGSFKSIAHRQPEPFDLPFPFRRPGPLQVETSKQAGARYSKKDPVLASTGFIGNWLL